MNLTIHLHIAPKLQISGLVLLLPNTLSKSGREQFYFINLKDTDPILHVLTDPLYSDVVSKTVVKFR